MQKSRKFNDSIFKSSMTMSHLSVNWSSHLIQNWKNVTWKEGVKEGVCVTCMYTLVSRIFFPRKLKLPF